jgi:hypothetical protein
MCYGCPTGFVGFLEDEKQLASVDPEFRGLVVSLNAIPGCGTYGVSDAGHFIPAWGTDQFYPQPWGHLGMAVLPRKKHVPELLQRLYAGVCKDPDARIGIKKDCVPCDYPTYTPGTKLKKYAQWETLQGCYAIVLEIQIGDNKCLDSVPEDQRQMCGPLALKGNREAFEKSKERCGQIHQFWKDLEGIVQAYNKEYGFIIPDFSKAEFQVKRYLKR